MFVSDKCSRVPNDQWQILDDLEFFLFLFFLFSFSLYLLSLHFSVFAVVFVKNVFPFFILLFLFPFQHQAAPLNTRRGKSSSKREGKTATPPEKMGKMKYMKKSKNEKCKKDEKAF